MCFFSAVLHTHTRVYVCVHDTEKYIPYASGYCILSFTYLRERSGGRRGETMREIFFFFICWLIPPKHPKQPDWVREKSEVKKKNSNPGLSPELQSSKCSKHHMFPDRLCIDRKLALCAEGGLEPRALRYGLSVTLAAA